MIVTPGSTDVTTYFALSLLADGADATGLTITNMDLQYVRSGVAPTAKVDAVALAATDTAHTDNRAIEIDATDQPGLYRVDWPDAAFAAGVREVVLTVKCDTAKTQHLRVQLQTIQTGDTFARVGAPAGASVSADVAAIKSDSAAILIDTAEIGAAGAGLTNINLPNQTMDIIGNITGNLSGSVGSVSGSVGGNVTGSVGSVVGAVGSVTGSVGGNVSGSVGSVAGSVTGSVASVVGAVGSVTGSVGSVVGVSASELHELFATTCNNRDQNKSTLAIRIKDNDGSSVLKTHTRSEDATHIILTKS